MPSRLRALLAGLLALALLAVLVLTAPAARPAGSASELPPQSLTVAGSASPEITPRDSFGVSYYTWPLEDRSTPVTSPFGLRTAAPCRGCAVFHRGTDFSWGLYGAPILSVARGTVVEVGDGGDYGSHVVVDYVVQGDAFRAIYGHMIRGSQTVAVGQVVDLGQPLGQMGSTGHSTGPHLHFEVDYGETPIDSLAWLRERVP